MRALKRIVVFLVKKLDLGSAVAVRLTKITGKSKTPIHPKHFLTEKPWFAKNLKKSDVVLDLGCGNGQNSIKAARIVKKVDGVDIDDVLLGIAKNSAENLKISNVKFEKADLEKKLNYKNNAFDKIIFLDVLEHLSNRDQILQEVKRVLKPGGLLFLAVPNSQTSWKRFQESLGVCSYSDPDHRIEFSREQIRALLKKHGFKIVKLGYGYFDTPLRGLFDMIGGLSLNLYCYLSDWRKRQVIKKPSETSGFEIVAKV